VVYVCVCVCVVGVLGGWVGGCWCWGGKGVGLRGVERGWAWLCDVCEMWMWMWMLLGWICVVFVPIDHPPKLTQPTHIKPQSTNHKLAQQGKVPWPKRSPRHNPKHSPNPTHSHFIHNKTTGQDRLAQAITKTQSLAWASLATMLRVEAPDIEMGVVDGIQVLHNIYIYILYILYI
jgi:hypothetical protein